MGKGSDCKFLKVGFQKNEAKLISTLTLHGHTLHYTKIATRTVFRNRTTLAPKLMLHKHVVM